MKVLSSKTKVSNQDCITKLILIEIDKKKFQLKVDFVKVNVLKNQYEIDTWDGANNVEYKKLRILFKEEPGIDQRILNLIKKHENTIN